MAAPTSQSSGLLGVTAGALLYSGRNIVNGLSVAPGATVTIYDNTIGDTSGNVVSQVVNAGTSTLDFIYNIGVRVNEGLSYVISGAGGNIIYFGGN